MTLDEFESRVRSGLGAGLPGVRAQLVLSPSPRRGWRPDVFPEGCRDGAGLLLAYPRDGETCLALTVRHDALPQHAGQVSLPGGAVDPGETYVQAALREAHEEIGVEPGNVRVLGGLTRLHVPVSRFVLHPVVGVADERPALQPRPGEVDRVLEPSLEQLEGSLGVETRQRGGVDYEVPFILVEGHKVWGATAMILAELLTLIGRPPVRR